MTYNNPFPASYQQHYQQPQQNTGSMIWVQGETGAKSYLLAPNTTIPLWDSEAQVIYLKSADPSGMPSIKTLDYTVREQPKIPNNEPKSDFVTHDELKDLEDKITHKIKEMLEETEA